MSNGADKPPAERASQATIHIDDLLANGQGVGRLQGLVAFVTGALPGEEASVFIEARKARYVSAHAREIVVASPDRIEPVCPVFGRCGGCQTLHFRYDAQLGWKQRMVAEALARVGGLSGFTMGETQPSNFFEGTRYRNKVALMVRRGGRRTELGFFEARSHALVPIAGCPVLLPWLDDAVRALIALVHKVPDLLADVKHVVARTAVARQTLVLALCSGRNRPDLRPAVNRLRQQIPALTGLVQSWDPPSENAVFGRRMQTLWGSDQTIEWVGGASFHFSVASFFQINTGVLERIAEALLARLAGSQRIVDLYCGVGTFGVLAARQGISVTGVESSPAAVDDAATNAAINGVTRAVFERLGVVEAVAGSRGRTLFDGADAVVIDPPRKGCEPEVIGALGSSRVPKLLYLSCNPATLARDARQLAESGYSPVSVIPFDMFPFTGHVEILAEFARSRAGCNVSMADGAQARNA